MIEVHNLGKHYKDLQILYNVSLNGSKGDLFAYLVLFTIELILFGFAVIFLNMAKD